MADDERLLLALEDTASTGFRVVGLRTLNYAVAFVASVIVARAIGPQGRGLVALPIAFLGIVMALTHVGVEQSNVYLAARGETLRRLWAASALIAVIASIAGWAVVAVAATVGPGFLGGLPASWVAVAVAQLPLLLTSLYWAGLLQIDGGLTTAVRATLAGTSAHAAGVGVLWVAGGLTPFRVLALTWVGVGVTWALLLRGGVRRSTAGSAIQPGLLSRAISFGLRAQFATLFTFLLLRVDQLMVQGVLGFRALGLYALAAVLAELLWLATGPFAASLLPHQMRAEPGDMRRLGFATARLALVVALAGGAIAWFAAPYLIRLAYGGAFEGAVWPLRLLLPGVAALALQRPLGPVLVTEGRMSLVALLNASALALNILLNVLLLERLGIAGASIASSITYVLLAVGYVVATRCKDVASWLDLVPTKKDFARLARGLRRRPPVRDRQPGPPRIVYVIGTLERGGAEGQLALLAGELARSGWQVTILCLSSAGPLADELERRGVEVVVAGFRGLTATVNPLSLRRVLGSIRHAIAERQPDIVHTYLYRGNLIGIRQGQRAGVPVLVSSLRSLRSAVNTRVMLRPWERSATRHSDAIVCNSQAVREDAVANGVPASRCRVILNGVSLPDHVTPPSGSDILTIANLIAYKGHVRLLEAFARVVETSSGGGARLLLAGQGPEEARLRTRAADLGISGRVEFLGSVGDVGSLLDACAFTVLPSVSEGMPNAVLESLAHGRAAIATATGGTSEVLSGGGGVPVPSDDVVALSAAIESLLADPDLTRILGEAGRRDVANRFGFERMIRETEDLYGELLRRHEVGVSVPSRGVERAQR